MGKVIEYHYCDYVTLYGKGEEIFEDVISLRFTLSQSKINDPGWSGPYQVSCFLKDLGVP